MCVLGVVGGILQVFLWWWSRLPLAFDLPSLCEADLSLSDGAW